MRCRSLCSDVASARRPDAATQGLQPGTKEQELAPIPEGVTFHSLRHTYASLMAEAGVDPAYTKAQIGHADARFTMSVYTHVGNRREAANARLDALVGGADGPVMGSEATRRTRDPSTR